MDVQAIAFVVYQTVGLALLLYAVIDLAGRSRTMSLLLFVVFPVALLPLILTTERNGWFHVARTLTMLFVGAYLTVMRCWFRTKPFTVFFALLFVLNIAEAAFQDLGSGHLVNFVSALLVIGMLPAPNLLGVDDQRTVVYPTSWCFIVVYSLWNFCFLFSYTSVRGFSGDYTLIAAVLLLVPIGFAVRFGAKTYTQARAYSLAFCITMVEVSLERLPESWPLTGEVLYSTGAHGVLSVFTLLVAIGGWLLLWRRRPAEYRMTLFAKTAARIWRKDERE